VRGTSVENTDCPCYDARIERPAVVSDSKRKNDAWEKAGRNRPCNHGSNGAAEFDMIRFEHVSKHYGGERPVLTDAAFQVHPGERVGIVGPNGAGKSTLFGMILGEVTPDSGKVEAPRGIRIGHVRQEPEPESDAQPVAAYVEQATGEAARIENEIAQVEVRLLEHPDETEKSRLLERLGNLQHRLEVCGAYETVHRARAALAGLGFRPEDVFRPVAEAGWFPGCCREHSEGPGDPGRGQQDRCSRRAGAKSKRPDQLRSRNSEDGGDRSAEMQCAGLCKGAVGDGVGRSVGRGGASGAREHRDADGQDSSAGLSN